MVPGKRGASIVSSSTPHLVSCFTSSEKLASRCPRSPQLQPPAHAEALPPQRLNSYTHMPTVEARFSDSMLPQPAMVNGWALRASSCSRGTPRASLPNR